MGATDVVPDRLTAAKAAAIDALRELPTGGKVSVIAADQSARIVVNDAGDLGRVRQAIESIPVTASTGDLGDALELASKLAKRSGDAQVLVATDAALAVPPTAKVDVPVKVLAVGRDRKNQAIVALAVRTSPSSVTRSVFISVANLDLERATRRIELWGDDHLLEARDVDLDAQARQDVIIDDVPPDVAAIEVRLVGRDPAVTDGAGPARPRRPRLGRHPAQPDPADPRRRPGRPVPRDRAVVPPERRAVRRDRGCLRPADRAAGRAAVGPRDLRGQAARDACRSSPILAIGPTASSPLGSVTGTLTNPGIGTLDPAEPVLRYVDLSTTHIAEAVQLALPDWARTVIPGPKNAPLLYAGERAGLRTAVLAFEPRQSDLPLQVAFPILLANLTGELLGGGAAPSEAVTPGQPVQLAIPAGASGLTVTTPDGRTIDLVPESTGGSLVTFAADERAGPVHGRHRCGTPRRRRRPLPRPAPVRRPRCAPSGPRRPGH